MATIQRNFVLGKMNKSLDERLVPNGEYIDALNIRLGSTEETEVGSVENSKGNLALTTLQYQGTQLSSAARCIGALADGANETLYWFVHDPSFPLGATGKIDMIISYNTLTQILTYHVISIDDGGGVNTTLNFNPQYLITGVDIIDEDEEGLLFFTDDYNPPRFINVERSYANPIGFIDQTSAESLLVIKRPPNNSLDINPISVPSEDNFLEDRFVCFAYRYQYEDGEYSATSQFSEPSFLPNPFSYDFSTGLNSGMLNAANLCVLTYNSGGPLVKSIDLLWKDMQTGNIRVIERRNKQVLGLADNTDYTYTFSSSKIFTILPESEILRLYDNVPRLAKAQTLMGNRLVYGNYLEQYDLVTLGGFSLLLQYTTSLESTEVGLVELTTSTDSGVYNWFIPTTILNSRLVIEDIGLQSLKAGSSISIEIRFQHSSFAGTAPVTTTGETELFFTYYLPQDFASAYDLATSVDFIEKIGSLANIQTVPNACVGTTLTDLFNCSIPSTLSPLTKYESGISGPQQPIQIWAFPTSNDIILQLPAMRFVDDPTGVAITQEAYEYYEIIFSAATFQEVGNPKSLHSNRSYEVGIIYMDEYSRASTALVSEFNTVHVPCSLADTANRIIVNIPPSQIAPYWATRYKFAIKADKENYFTIYSNFFFQDPVTSATYFLLEGQNARKVEEGDILIVKADTNGPLGRCAYATVLEKSSKGSNFLNPPPVDNSGNTISVPEGVYMKIRANEFATDVSDLPFVGYGQKTDIESSGDCPNVAYPVDIEDPANPSTYIDYTIPAGSRIRIFVENLRKGKSCSVSQVERRYYKLDVTLTASADYPNFKDWWDGDNVQQILMASNVIREADCGQALPTASYNPTTLLSSLGQDNFDAGCNIINNFFQFYYDDAGTGRKYLVVTGTKGYNGKNKQSKLSVKIEVIRASNLIVFETQPQDALPDVWYESSESYAIDPATGFHEGNIQNQTVSLPAIIKTEFFNCYAFGNGVESYKIRDAIEGRELLLGNRVTTTSAQEYREIRRFADLTYSGVYNDETNVNKLNEFNLGLLNFKPLEDSYGPVYILDGRETDILVLQEDKVSFVLAGKNLISDSTGGSVISSVPEVLGTQVARTENFGISFHPESYTRWGFDKFFTDAKRGAVIQMKGTSGQSEQLKVISDMGMRSWFRDLFISSFNTQKLGAYDPYMGEYVLSSNDIRIPVIEECIDCGITREFSYLGGRGNDINFCVNVGNLVGDVNINYQLFVVESDVQIDAVYNGIIYSTGPITNSSGSPLVVPKNIVSEDVIEVTISGTGAAVLEVTVECPQAQLITVIQVCYSLNGEAGQNIHNEYNWTDGVYISPTHSAFVTLASGTNNPLISQYNAISAFQGGAFVPADGATVSIISNRIPPVDDFVFDVGLDNFRWLRTNVLYNNTPVDMAALFAAANLATPTTGGGNTYQAQFTMPFTNDQYLYLIYDYRSSTEVSLCLAETLVEACCICGSSNLTVRLCNQAEEPPIIVVVANTFGVSVGAFVQIDYAGYEGCVWEVISETEETATNTITGIRTDITNCNQVCNVYRLTSSNLEGGVFGNYYDCEGNTIPFSIFPTFGEPPVAGFIDICATGWETLDPQITAQLIDCVCPNHLLVERCGDRLQEFIAVGTASIGDFVRLSGYPEDCIWEVVTYTANTPTVTVASITEFTSCDQVCKTFQYVNSSGAPASVSYLDCNGDPQTINMLGEASGTFCAFYITGTTGTPTISPSFLFPCGCNENLLVQQCRIDGVIAQEVIPAGSASIGDFIQNTDAGCTYEVIAYTTNPVTIPAPVPTAITCAEACDTYTITNTGSVALAVAYIDCDGNGANTPIIDVGNNLILCARQIDVPAGWTLAFSGCGCGD